VLGEFKRGKSTLINALLEREAVPTGVLPLTAAVILVRHGEAPRLVVDFEDGSRREAALDEVAAFATEAGNPENRLGVRLVALELPSPLLAAGIQLVDTPGIGSVFAHNTETALGFLGQVDAGLFTLAADQPLSAAEEALIREAAERLPRLFFALNKLDRVEAEHEEVVAFVRRRLADVLGEEPELYPLSARTGEGIERLRHRLEQLAASEREQVLAGSVGTLAAAFATEALRAIAFEAHAVELPLVELERRLADFRERAATLGRTREEAAELLVQAARRLVREAVDEPLLSLARREGSETVASLRTFAAEQHGAAPRLLAGRLGDWIDRTVSDRFTRLAAEYEERLADELANLHERYAARVEAILDELDEAVAQAFGARVGRLGSRVSLRRPSRFTFKLHEPEREPLDQLASAAAASLPGLLGRRLVLRQAEERLLLLLNRHAGRLRSDLAARIEESIREYARELGSTVQEAVAAVEAAVERAAGEQRGGRARVDARLAELREVERRVSQLRATIGGAP
jgi:hypothetical protein